MKLKIEYRTCWKSPDLGRLCAPAAGPDVVGCLYAEAVAGEWLEAWGRVGGEARVYSFLYGEPGSWAFSQLHRVVPANSCDYIYLKNTKQSYASFNKNKTLLSV